MAIFNAHERDRVQVFIDGMNLYATCRSMDQKFNYKLLMDMLQSETRLIRASYFTVVREEHKQNENFIKMLDFLDYNGYEVVHKEVHDAIDAYGRSRQRGSIDVEMAVAISEAATIGGCDHAIIFSGNRELEAAIASAKKNGTRVTVVSSVSKGVVSDTLRLACDQYIDVEDLPSGLVIPLDEDFPRLEEAA